MKKAAIYVRNASNEATGNNSIANQKTSCLNYVSGKDIDVTKIYMDEGTNGLRVDKCHQLKMMLKDMEEGLFDTIIVKNISRISRKPDILIDIYKVSSSSNVEIITVDEHINKDNSGMFFLMIDMVAELDLKL